MEISLSVDGKRFCISGVRALSNRERWAESIPMKRRVRGGKILCPVSLDVVRSFSRGFSDGLISNADFTPNALRHYRRLQERRDEINRQLIAAQKYKDDDAARYPVAVRRLNKGLFKHQLKGAAMCIASKRFILNFDPGLGKTLTALAVVLSVYDKGRVLVVSKKSILNVWREEIAESVNHPHSAISWEQYQKDYKKGLIRAPKDLTFVITTYDKLARRMTLANRSMFEAFDMAILDESHSLKTPKSTRTEAFLRARHWFERVILLTGTLYGQKPESIWGQMSFLSEGIVEPHISLFRKHYYEYDPYVPHKVLEYKHIDYLRKRVSPWKYTVRKHEALDLPEQTFVNRFVEMTPEVKKIYQNLKTRHNINLQDQFFETKDHRVMYQKLRQIASGAMYVEQGEDYVELSKMKVSALAELLEDFEDKAVVFCNFSHELDMIEEMLAKRGEKYLRMDGSTPENTRDKYIRAFNETAAGSPRLFIAQIRTGAEGISLTAAAKAVFMSPTISFIDYVQACSRIHRPGQNRRVTYYNILVDKTIDIQIAKELQKIIHRNDYLVND